MKTDSRSVETGRKVVFDEQAREFIRSKWFFGNDSMTEAQFEEFLLICERSGLDPMRGTIMPMFLPVYNDKGKVLYTEMRPYTTVDGMAELAQQTGMYGGLLGMEWCGGDGVWKDSWLADEPPAAARARVKRLGTDEAITMVAMRKEFMPKKPSSFWRSMPSHMLGKCAFAIALRWAFPQALQGIYASEELDNVVAEEKSAAGPVKITDAASRKGNHPAKVPAPANKPKVAEVRPAQVDDEDRLAAEDNEEAGEVTNVHDALATRLDSLYPRSTKWATTMGELPEPKFNWLVRDMVKPVANASPDTWRIWGAVEFIRAEMREAEVKIPADWRKTAKLRASTAIIGLDGDDDDLEYGSIDEELEGEKTP